MTHVAAVTRPVPVYPRPTRSEALLDLVFPPTCVGCGRVGRWICEACWGRVPWDADGSCQLCGRPWLSSSCAHCGRVPTSLDATIAVARFDGVAREAVHALKYHGHHAISSLLGRLMAAAMPALEISVVTPVPLHRSRRRQRGYDQAALLARHVARALDVPLDAGLLTRTRATQDQVGLDGEARRLNLDGAFTAESRVAGEDVLLIDDVFTTGATMETAAACLREMGARRVVGLAFAQTP